MPGKVTWDIFCCVVDNFGDVGVTWRLARQLVAEHGMSVRLWIDDMGTFARLVPQADCELGRQYCAGVEICQWPRLWQPVEPADVVVEAFACDLPEAYVRAMAAATRRILWINLEYLSAEDWILDCHAIASLRPDGLQKYFFFPGFVAGSGGLLRERDLLARRSRFQADDQARLEFLGRLGVEADAGCRLISLFAYENPALAGWFDELSRDERDNLVLVPQGRVLGDVQAWAGVGRMRAGDCHERGSLRIVVLPFLTQDDYDRLLWCCDFNAVRGEESFIRAQWAGRAFVWHIYRQEEDAHWDKLRAFFRLYAEGLSDGARAALKAFWHAWNLGQEAGDAWNGLLAYESELAVHAGYWADAQALNGDLASNLLRFHADWASA
ncbi:elongation factor P maturation arginine rhamnosyltransferase EarP [Stutzerimonas kirkiae]|uniref:Protein-arginine rhamnosyltransferase n=1 Tax=Stutzerimonas kirkiae TaxID=2211392 RepID=A0A4Q9QV73_9GAMM|nr:elongation factor P maturation arginine rhamnosyltransferase EarP [Stutzerimonas kirkiae]TBU87624.1 elongation factor P maturation arginine rhamnosyltransferase EarP [Stutzerimonas kirkiae]TBU98010.1 elongation factor P maturation arginine rhamnosyltransferase EarP [Stutzerimonas kirkiae]TBV02215.1 elongation factor P maturation arginine rhamnosyltransferase EarP [Stutzerimonas kirkiae]TBV17306.1 elongation factor P maturation arginine rhamnosyltransferase EarP [Stutzerimonas kirkiae]